MRNPYNPQTLRESPVRDRIIAALKEYGPMPVHEIAEVLELPNNNVSRIIRMTRLRWPGCFFRIISWLTPKETGVPGMKNMCRVYAFTGGKDVPKPEVNREECLKQNQARFRERNRAKIRARKKAARIKKKESAKPAQASPWDGLGQRAKR